MKPYTLHQLKAAWPEIEAALRPKPKPKRAPARPPSTVATSYVEAALTGEWQAVKNARPPTSESGGNRNSTLNTAAYKLGTLVGAGVLRDDEAINTLLDAVERQADPLPSAEALRTIRRALADGKRNPRKIA